MPPDEPMLDAYGRATLRLDSSATAKGAEPIVNCGVYAALYHL